MARLYRRRRRIKPPPPKKKEATATQKSVGSPDAGERYDPKACEGTLIVDMIPPAPKVSRPQDRDEAERQSRMEQEYFKRGYTLFERGLYEEAIKKFNTVLKMCPDDPDVNFNTALCYQYLGKPKSALKALLDTLRGRPRWADAWYLLSSICLKLEMFAEAEEACCYAIKDGCKEEESAYERLGRVLWAQKRFREAAEVLEDALKIYPENAVAHYFIGQYQYRQAKLGEAKKSLEGAVKHSPKFVEAWNALGRVQCLMGLIFEARPSFDKALEVNAENKIAKRWAGFVAGIGKGLAACLPAVMPEYRIPASTVDAYVQLGLKLIEEKKYEIAVETLELANEQFPDTPAIEMWYGVACALTNQFDIAMDTWLKVFDDQPENPQLRLLLTLGYTITCRKKKAEELQQSIKGKVKDTLGALIGSIPVAYDQPWASNEEPLEKGEGEEDEEESSVVAFDE